MKSPSLDAIYSQLDKHILLAQSYTEIKELFFIIRACRLKPYDYIFGEQHNKLILHRHWFDEFGNSFYITNNKRIKITYNDLMLDHNKIVCTDLYHGLSIDKVVKISKLAYVCTGKEEESYQDCALITFLGIDNYLRSYTLIEGEWQQVSPLTLGLKNLKVVGSNRDIHYFREFSIKENAPFPCVSPEAWLTFIPPSRVFTALIERRCEIMAPLFNNTKE